MIAQRTFKKTYVENLADRVRNGYDLDLYGKEAFPYDKDEVLIIPTIRYPEGLLNKLIPTAQGDCQSAIALYEAYLNLTPLQASDRVFWTYLAHGDLFEYVQARFPKVTEDDFGDSQYVLNHWFSPKDWPFRHPLASLWWFVYLTLDEGSEDKYKYTRKFFESYEFRTNFIKYSIARHKEALIGYFDFLMENEEVMSQFFKGRNRFITKYLNKLGGSRLLSTLDRNFFKAELIRIKPQILAVTSNYREEENDGFDDSYFEE